ncbi:hypothetical protein FPZ22_09475 [Luteimonas granuli]|uniref:Type II/III secretion system secretin-like domain-containing protein n=1 Tax=Luteimonas granuli TaxID=1176533 RepID=A0A518N7P8_9GAMM|nr:hypothetical protein FPZ22_09475 [Luteimonas granuli]
MRSPRRPGRGHRSGQRRARPGPVPGGHRAVLDGRGRPGQAGPGRGGRDRHRLQARRRRCRQAGAPFRWRGRGPRPAHRRRDDRRQRRQRFAAGRAAAPARRHGFRDARAAHRRQPGHAGRTDRAEHRRCLRASGLPDRPRLHRGDRAARRRPGARGRRGRGQRRGRHGTGRNRPGRHPQLPREAGHLQLPGRPGAHGAAAHRRAVGPEHRRQRQRRRQRDPAPDQRALGPGAGHRPAGQVAGQAPQRQRDLGGTAVRDRQVRTGHRQRPHRAGRERGNGHRVHPDLLRQRRGDRQAADRREQEQPGRRRRTGGHEPRLPVLARQPELRPPHQHPAGDRHPAAGRGDPAPRRHARQAGGPGGDRVAHRDRQRIVRPGPWRPLRREGVKDRVITSGSIEANQGLISSAATAQPGDLLEWGDNALNNDFSIRNLNPGSIAFTILGNTIDWDLELQALQQEQRGEVVSNPRVVTSNQREAIIRQGREVGYLTVTGGQSNNVPTVQFKEALLELKVTPTITADGRVFLTLGVKKDEIEDFTEISGFGSVPNLAKREVTTAVLIEDGQTVVIGGVYEFSDRNSMSKIPFLGDLPILGNLFRTKGRSKAKAELLIFVTPRVLRVAQRSH